MSTDSAVCFDTLAADTRWRAFDAEERRKVGAFVRRWGIKPGDRVLEPGCGAGRFDRAGRICGGVRCLA